jgi:hypothetical protein
MPAKTSKMLFGLVSSAPSRRDQPGQPRLAKSIGGDEVARSIAAII